MIAPFQVESGVFLSGTWTAVRQVLPAGWPSCRSTTALASARRGRHEHDSERELDGRAGGPADRSLLRAFEGGIGLFVPFRPKSRASGPDSRLGKAGAGVAPGSHPPLVCPGVVGQRGLPPRAGAALPGSGRGGAGIAPPGGYGASGQGSGKGSGRSAGLQPPGAQRGRQDAPEPNEIRSSLPGGRQVPSSVGFEVH